MSCIASDDYISMAMVFVSSTLYCMSFVIVMRIAFQRRKNYIIIPPAVASILMSAGVIIAKYAFDWRAPAYPVDCCLRFIIATEKTMPSLHAAIVMQWGIHFTRRAIANSKSVLVNDVPASVDRWELLTIWLFVVMLCYSRIHLHVSSEVDVAAGIVIGLLFSIIQSKLEPHILPLVCNPDDLSNELDTGKND